MGLKPINRQTDAGFTFGGPVPLGGYNKDHNRLFFFFALSTSSAARRQPTRTASRCRPRSSVTATSRRRATTTAIPSTFIRDYTTGLPCTAADTRGCFQDGGVLGRIPAEPPLRARASTSSTPTRMPNAERRPASTTTSQVAVQPSTGARRSSAPTGRPATPGASTARYFNNTNNAAPASALRLVRARHQPAAVPTIGHPPRSTTCRSRHRRHQPDAVLRSHLRHRPQLDLHPRRATAAWNRTRLGLTGLPLLFPNAVQHDYAAAVPARRPLRQLSRTSARTTRRSPTSTRPTTSSAT